MRDNVVQNSFSFELQVALGCVGLFLIFSLVVYNFIKSRRFLSRSNKKADQNLISSSVLNESIDKIHEDVSSVRHRIEPVFLNAENSIQHLPLIDNPTSPKVLDPELSLLSPPEVFENSIHNTVGSLSSDIHLDSKSYISILDPTIDAIISLHFPLRVGGNEILTALQKWPHLNFKYVLEGLSFNDDGDVAKDWSPINEKSSSFRDYSEIQFGVQLANRRGPILSNDLSFFYVLLQQLAQDLDAEIDLPPSQDVLLSASQLDQFGMKCDVQLGFSLLIESGTVNLFDLQNYLLNKNFVLSRDGNHFNFLEQEYLLFKVQVPNINFLRADLQNSAFIAVTFSIDVPLVKKELQPLNRMFVIANKLAEEINGKLIDDNGNTLSSESVDQMYSYLEPIYSSMEEMQILPGSFLASRLFS